MFNLQNDNILVSIDEHTGLTSGIFSPNDKDSMNWILENSEWGLINSFKTNDVAKNENTVIVKTVNEKNKIEAIIEKEITFDSYYEKYIIKINTSLLYLKMLLYFYFFFLIIKL